MSVSKPSQSQPGRREQREYFRVWSFLPIRARKTKPEERHALHTEISARRPETASRLDPELVAWLDRIECKLERLLAHMDLSDRPDFGPDDVQEVQISGSGILFTSETPGRKDDLLLVEFEVPGTPRRMVRCLGRVARAEPAGEGLRQIAVGFDVIHESDRDAIVQHVLAVQRSDLSRRQDGSHVS